MCDCKSSDLRVLEISASTCDERAFTGGFEKVIIATPLDVTAVDTVVPGMVVDKGKIKGLLEMDKEVGE